MLVAAGIGGAVMVGESDKQAAENLSGFLQAVAESDLHDHIKIAMTLGSFYESSFRHIGTPYVDRLGKGQPLTVCNGITGKGVVSGRYYSPADCLVMERERYVQADSFLRHHLGVHYTKATLWQKATLIDFVHNLGTGAYLGSTMHRLAKAGNMVAACKQNPRWVYGTVKGVETALPGLVTRRGANEELCLGGL